MASSTQILIIGWQACLSRALLLKQDAPQEYLLFEMRWPPLPLYNTISARQRAHVFLPDMLVRGDPYILRLINPLRACKMPIRPRVLQFGVETAHQRLSDSLIGPQSGAKTAIGHVSGRSQPAWEMDRSCHERSTCERAPRCSGLWPRGQGRHGR